MKLTPFKLATVTKRGYLYPNHRRRMTRIKSGHCRLCSKVFRNRLRRNAGTRAELLR